MLSAATIRIGEKLKMKIRTWVFLCLLIPLWNCNSSSGGDELDPNVEPVTEGNWYRIEFGDDFGWILSSSATLESNCAGLRVFENSFAEDGEFFRGKAPASLTATRS